MLKNNSWYIRRGEELQGPFASGLIKRYILLGRLRMCDQISANGLDWQPLSNLSQLHPSEMNLDLTDSSTRERFLAAMRWADERLGPDRRDARLATQEDLDRRNGDRRAIELAESVNFRKAKLKRMIVEELPRKNFNKLVITSIIIAAILVALYLVPSSPIKSDIDCSSPAGPSVKWSNCAMQGRNISGLELNLAVMRNTNFTSANLQATRLVEADLSYASLNRADLQGANLQNSILIGSDLRYAKLINADLSGADLSYSDLTGAQLSNSNFTGTKLDKAIWIDGKTCDVGSTGKCRHNYIVKVIPN